MLKSRDSRRYRYPRGFGRGLTTPARLRRHGVGRIAAVKLVRYCRSAKRRRVGWLWVRWLWVRSLRLRVDEAWPNSRPSDPSGYEYSRSMANLPGARNP